MARSLCLLLAALIVAPSSVRAAPADPVTASLQAKPADVAMTLPVGVSRVGSALAYRPRDTPPGRLSLVILFHGAGGDPRRFLDEFKGLADRKGYLLLAPRSAGRSWELAPPRKGRATLSADAANLDSALADLFARAPVEPQRIVALGFSDGASYALSVGLANPQLIRGVVALSVGFAWKPPRIDPTQRLFIAHGRHDRILPFANVRDQIVPGLQRNGLEPRVRWFNGGHTIDRKGLEEGLGFALGEER